MQDKLRVVATIFNLSGLNGFDATQFRWCGCLSIGSMVMHFSNAKAHFLARATNAFHPQR